MKLSLYISTSKTQLQSEGISLPSPKAYVLTESKINDGDMEV